MHSRIQQVADLERVDQLFVFGLRCLDRLLEAVREVKFCSQGLMYMYCTLDEYGSTRAESQWEADVWRTHAVIGRHRVVGRGAAWLQAARRRVPSGGERAAAGSRDRSRSRAAATRRRRPTSARSSRPPSRCRPLSARTTCPPICRAQHTPPTTHNTRTVHVYLLHAHLLFASPARNCRMLSCSAFGEPTWSSSASTKIALSTARSNSSLPNARHNKRMHKEPNASCSQGAHIERKRRPTRRLTCVAELLAKLRPPIPLESAQRRDRRLALAETCSFLELF